MDSTLIGAIFVDEHLHIRRFTPSAQVAVSLGAESIGRSIRDLPTKLEDLDLASLTRSVLSEGRGVETSVRTTDGTPLLVRVHPYALAANSAGGAVITFADMATAEAAQQKGFEQASILPRIAAASRDVFWMMDLETLRMLYVSPAFERIWGLPVDSVLRAPMFWLLSVHPEDRERVEQEFLLKLPGDNLDIEYRILRPDGAEVWVRDRTYGSVTTEDNRRTVIGIAEEITGRVNSDRQRRRTIELYRQACDRVRAPMLLVAPDGTIIWSNTAARKSPLGAPDAIPGTMAELLSGRKDRKVWDAAVLSVLATAIEKTVHLDVKRQKGDPLRCEVELALVREAEADEGFLVCQWINLSSQLAIQEAIETRAEVLAGEADRDPLTELLSRRGVERVLERQFALSGSGVDQTMVVLIDLDHFKDINDEHGHVCGDRALREAARRIAGSLRPSDLLARVGGDEFLAVLPATRLAEGAYVGERLRRSISDEPMRFDGKEIRLTASVGVTSAPSASASVETLLGAAGEVLRNSKRVGRDRVTFSRGDGTVSHMPMVSPALEQMLAGGITVVAQTLNDVRTGKPVGYEFFCRGPEPVRMPDTFFEESRRINCLEDLDLVCLESCVKQASRLTSSKRLHVNLFPSSLVSGKSPGVEEILSAVRKPERFCIELSEQQLIGPSSEVGRQVEKLRKMGFKIALDDVGFGNSALETLLVVEPDVVKIDKSIVCFIDQQPDAERTLDRIVSMLGRLGAEIIAEGVEREEQRQILDRIGIRIGQGYLWSRPESVI
ncbi:MAG TPA: EAL domain-containing protein [Terriglobia bacterium]|nr:EAL domain-containing protein [Terriglobia bacterium]